MSKLQRLAELIDRLNEDEGLSVASVKSIKYLAKEALAEAAMTGAASFALNTRHPDSHKAADAFWSYWNENGETHKHGYYESTWGAINRAIRMVGVVEHSYTPKEPS